MNKLDSIAKKINNKIFSEETDYENLEGYLEKNGIDVRYINSNVLDGYLRWDQKSRRPVIAVSVTGNVPARRRFTMAHELGHLILDYHWIPGENNSKVEKSFKNKNILSVLAYRGKANYTSEERQKEARANSFAASFLIPIDKIKNLIDDDLKKQKNSDELISDVVKEFHVSKETAIFRTKHVLEKYISHDK